MALSIPYIFLLAVSLSMDAFAVSISAGISMQRASLKEAVRIALAFGIFQALMPVAGFFGASYFYDYISKVDHWIAFILLAFIGGKMIVEAYKKGDECEIFPDGLSNRHLLILAIATSIDALAAGVGINMLSTEIFIPAILIGLTTFLFSFFGFRFGIRLGCRFGNRMEMIGGAVLILIGLKVLFGDLFGN